MRLPFLNKFWSASLVLLLAGTGTFVALSQSAPPSIKAITLSQDPLYASGADAFSADHARLLALLSPSLAMSVAVLPKGRAWTAAKPEPLRPAAGELRLLRRRT